MSEDNKKHPKPIDEAYFFAPCVLFAGILGEAKKDCCEKIVAYSFGFRKSELIDWIKNNNDGSNEAVMSQMQTDFRGIFDPFELYKMFNNKKLDNWFNSFSTANNGKKCPNFALSYKSAFKIVEWEKHILICWLIDKAIKSIIGKKAYTITSKVAVLSRASGLIASDESGIDENLLPLLSKKYQFDKVIEELSGKYYGLCYYSTRGVRGFYVSYKLDAETLESICKKQLEKQRKKKRAKNR